MIKPRQRLSRPAIVVMIVAFILAGILGIWFFVSRAAQNPAADLNQDGQINVFDLSQMLTKWSQSGTGDLNGDNTVNILDLSILLASWGPVSTVCSGIAITPSSNIQTAINNAATGATFCFAPGTYTNVSSLNPKTGQTFDGGNRTAILDGAGTRSYAFRSTTADNVTIKGFVIKRYNTQLQDGAIHSFDSTGWTIENNHITLNASTGVATDSDAKVLNNLIDHNGQQGFAAHGENILYEGNEIAYNNADLAVDALWEAGGGKTWDTRYAVFKNNNVHHNGGNGLWDDTNNIYITYDGNTVNHNTGAGIYHEIGYDATIINNTAIGNGMAEAPGGEGLHDSWLWNAGIQIRSSGALTSASPMRIENNTVTNNRNGIAIIESPAAGCTNTSLNEGKYGPCIIQNIIVKNNVVTMSQGGTGAVQDGAGQAIFTTRNVKFENNTYHVSSLTHPNDGYAFGWFAWADDWHTWTEWKSYGHDLTGSFGL